MDRRSFLKSLAASLAAASIPVSAQALEAAAPELAELNGWYRISQHVRAGKVISSMITKIIAGPGLNSDAVAFSGDAAAAKNKPFDILPKLANMVSNLPKEYTVSCYIRVRPQDDHVGLYGAQLEMQPERTNYVVSTRAR